MAASIVRLSDEQQVNTHTLSAQQYQSITALKDGGWLVTWSSQNQDGSGYGIYQQRYNADGIPRDNERLVNTETYSTQNFSDVTALADGGWVVTWVTYDASQGGYRICQQRYTDTGIPRDGERRIGLLDQVQEDAQVTALPDGGWVVTWISTDLNDTGNNIYLQKYDKSGQRILDMEQRVNTTLDYTRADPAITTLADGGWVVTWTDSLKDGSAEGIFQKRYSANGEIVGEEQPVNTGTSGSQIYSSVTALKDGGWVVTWTTKGNTADTSGIFQQRYDAKGAAVGGEQKVNTSAPYHANLQSSVTALADGGWVVTWSALEQDRVNADVVQQRYNAEGVPVGGEQRVNAYTALKQYNPAIAGLEDGSWVVTWTSDGQDGALQGVYQQFYETVAAFCEGREHGSGTALNDTFDVRNGGFGAGDTLEGGGGIDTLRMIESGTLDLTAPDAMTGIEILQGSAGNDIVVIDAARLGQIVGLRGGAGFDELRLQMGDYDFNTNALSGFEMISFSGPGTLTFADKAAALLAHSLTANGSVSLTGDAFTLAERQQLYIQGIRQVSDAKGMHVLQPGDIFLNRNAARENAGKGTVIGELSAVDPNPDDGLRMELADSAGGRFALSGNRLVVANGKLLDHESATSHRIVVRMTDEGGIAVDKAFTINVDDVPVEVVRGTRRADVLKGGTSKDRLYGDLGKDMLTGGKGQDVFVFDAKPNKKTNLDKIADFSVKDDSIWLDNKVFTKLGKAGSETKPAQMKKGYFVKGAKAKDKDDYVVYDNKKGVLYYDADGSGSKYKQVEIATLAKKLALTHKDFFVI